VTGAVTLRPARAADVPAMAHIFSGWKAATPWMPKLHGPAEDRAFLEALVAGRGVTVAADPVDRALGFLALGDARIDQLYVAAPARRLGIGARLTEAAKAASARLSLWCFQANAPALAFYAAQGFAEARRTGGSGNAEGLPDIYLTWKREDRP